MNIMVEAMTQGGFVRHGRCFSGRCSRSGAGLIFLPQGVCRRIDILQEGKSYHVDGVSFETPLRHIHAVETYGLTFRLGDRRFSYIADSRYFDKLIEKYQSEMIIINVVFVDNPL
jgi:hypothetical protein